VKLYTRTGDRGETGLFDGTRVSKADPRVEAYGAIDELNALIGLARASGIDGETAGMLESVQRDLFAAGSMLADPAGRISSRLSRATLGGEEVTRVEGWIDRLEAETPPLRRFILAGGCQAGAVLHLARTVCRRAERRVVSLGADHVPASVIVYLNRLSDLLFAMARAVNHRAGAPEAPW
jgi:cob(I)alamin adenosyltransferase